MLLESFRGDALRSFLDQEVNVVDTQRSQLLVRTLEVKQKSAKGNVDLAIHRITCQQSCLLPHLPSLKERAVKNSHILPLPLLKPIHLTPTNIIKHIRKRVLLCTLFPPSLAHILFSAVQV
jgi:hypothetical protein